jgi:hypothetical protein
MAQDDEKRAFRQEFDAELTKLDRQFTACGIDGIDRESVRVHVLRKSASLQEPLSAYEWATLMEELASRLWMPTKWFTNALVRSIFWVWHIIRGALAGTFCGRALLRCAFRKCGFEARALGERRFLCGLAGYR